jgi:NAD(P)H-hydrate repair Nnr-like enzyme with NAD(P)H-hydrate dehydratase domain
VTRKWRKLHNEELRDLYSSSSIIRTIKSRRMSTNKGEAERVWVIGGKARGKETTRKTKT